MVDDHSIGATAYLAALHHAGVSHFVTVPDFVQFALHQAVERGDSDMRVVRTCNEDQAVCVAAGLTIAGQRPIVVVQNQGFYASINSIRAVSLDAQIPTVLLIGQFGREFDNFGHSSKTSRRRVVNLLEPLLDTLGIPFWNLERNGDVTEAVSAAFDAAHTRHGPAALVVGRPTAWH